MRKLRATWTPELAEDLRNMHDAPELRAEIAEQDEPTEQCNCVDLCHQIESKRKALESSCEIHGWEFVHRWSDAMDQYDPKAPTWAERDNLQENIEQLEAEVKTLEVKLSFMTRAAAAGPLPPGPLAVPGLTALGEETFGPVTMGEVPNMSFNDYAAFNIATSEVKRLRSQLDDIMMTQNIDDSSRLNAMELEIENRDLKMEVDRLKHDRDRLMRDRDRSY